MRAVFFLTLLVSAFGSEWSKTYGIPAVAEVDLRCRDANVDLRQGASGRVEARLTTKGVEIAPGEVEVIERQSGSRVEIEVRTPHTQGWNWHRQGTRNISLSLEIPANTHLTLHTGDGNVNANGISGDLRLETGDGNIIGHSLSGKVAVQTGDGNVRLQGRFEALAVSTGDGNVEITADAGSQNVDTWRVKSGDGNVRLRVPPDLRAEVDASTGDGHITSDLPVDTRGFSDRRHLRGRLNGGGSLLTIRTGDGNIDLKSYR